MKKLHMAWKKTKKMHHVVENVKVNAFITNPNDEDVIDYNDDDPEDAELTNDDEEDILYDDEDEDEEIKSIQL